MAKRSKRFNPITESNSIWFFINYIMTEENLLYAADYFAFLGKKISDHEI